MFEKGTKFNKNSNYAYYIEKKIGQGAFGMVYEVKKVHHSEGTRASSYALKLLETDKKQENKEEVKILIKLNNNNHIIKHIEDFDDYGYYCIITEYCEVIVIF